MLLRASVDSGCDGLESHGVLAEVISPSFGSNLRFLINESMNVRTCKTPFQILDKFFKIKNYRYHIFITTG